jgi:hypothetical protein
MKATRQLQSIDTITLPSPTGGLNAYDNFATMPPTDAIVLSNLVPQPYGCMVRKGYIQHASGLATDAPVGTGAVLANTDGSQNLYAWADDSFYEITATGPVGAALLTGLNSPWWQTVQMANSAGAHLVCFNGVDAGIWVHDDGVTIDRLVPGDGIVNATWNGVDPSDLIQATVHQRRLWAVEVNTTFGWFLPPDSIYGVADFYDFGPFFKSGGYLQILATWTVDAGEGSDDHLVAVSSNGEAAVFAGTDPTDPTAWRLVGVYFIGRPVAGRRFYTNVAGDLYMLTYTGVVSMATVVTSTQVNVAANNTYSKKIQFLLSDLTASLGDLDGWDMKFFASNNLLFINVPSVYFGGSAQIVSNHINSAWCTFTGMDALAWFEVDGAPYFCGKTGIVYRAWYADKDNILVDGSEGTDILSDCQQAYNYFGRQAVQKQVGMYRPNLVVAKPVTYNSGILYDFRQRTLTYPSGAVPTPGGSSLWGIALWGLNLWSGGLQTQREWRMASGMGVAVSVEIGFSTSAETTWVSTELTVKSGGIL